MKRILSLALLPALLWAVTASSNAQDSKKDPRAALQAFNEYIGSWQGDGKGKVGNWAESIEWGWKFKGADAWLVFKIKDGKAVKGGEVRPVADKMGVYKVEIEDANGKKVAYEGSIDDKGVLKLVAPDPDTKGNELRVRMFIAGDGVFFNYAMEKGKAGSKIGTDKIEVRAKKDGVVFKAGSKQPECVVSGGLGTTAVQFQGKTYYICCSGCADAFRDNPEKWVKEFEAKKKK